MPCVLLLILTVPLIFPPGPCSIDTLARASSPKTERAWRLAERNPQSPLRDDRGVRQFMLVDFCMWVKYSLRSLDKWARTTLEDKKRLRGYIRHRGMNNDLVFPLKLAPHLPEAWIVGVSRRDVIENVDPDLVQDDRLFGVRPSVIDYRAKDHSGFRGGDLDVSSDALLGIRTNGVV